MASWLMAVMLIGTRLMLSSRRVAVTTISSSPAGAAAVSVSAAASLARAVLAAQVPAHTIRVRKNNTCQETRRIAGLAYVADMVSPKIIIWPDNSKPTVTPRKNGRNRDAGLK